MPLNSFDKILIKNFSDLSPINSLFKEGENEKKRSLHVFGFGAEKLL